MQTETVFLKVDNLKIVGRLYLPDGASPYPVVCICHGIPAGPPDPSREGYAQLAEKVCREGLAAFIFNFRGTGASGGNLDILGWTRDLEAALDYLSGLKEIFASRLALLGFSAGGAVSIYVASKDPRVSSVAACAAPAEFTFWERFRNAESLLEHFRQIGAIRDEGFPSSLEEWFGGFERVSPVKYVAGIAPRPLLLVHGSADEVVGVSDAHRLYAEAGEPKELVIIRGGKHRLRQDKRAVDVFLKWLKSCV